VSPDYSVFDVSPEVNPEYIAALFRGEKMRAKFRSESKGLGTGTSGFLRLYDDRLGAIHAAMPERREQEEILDCLTQSIAGINQAIAKAEREIALIEEFRTTLISEVVTGKRDIHQLTAAKEPL
jgi:type I restriction enzyme S subunit